MKKFLALTALIFARHIVAKSQVYITKAGFVGFYSRTPLEDIRAENKQVYAVVDAGKKNIAFTLLMKNFIFPRKLMQEHFNENYAESDKFPKAVLTGSYTGDVDLEKDGAYPVMVTGQLGLHGVIRLVEVPANIEIKGGRLTGKAQFKIKPEDYKIKIPSIVVDKIAKEVTVSVNIDCTTK
ncbi:MAG TPA: YceI family protein [Chitinophagaceae bacterium]|nr:YceI family protein [Chitinophagaceae bacterium]